MGEEKKVRGEERVMIERKEEKRRKGRWGKRGGRRGGRGKER